MPIQHLLRQTIGQTVRSYAQLVTSRDSSPNEHGGFVQHPYFLARNTRGSLPVYTDIRNGGTRYLVLIRNVEGDVNALAKDLAETLFERNSQEAARMKIVITRKHLVLTGGRWKNRVVEWLVEKGF